MIQIYGRKKCRTTQKAQRFFSERRIKTQAVDLDQRPPGAREVDLFVQAAGAENLVDVDSKQYKKRGLAYMDYDIAQELAEDPALFRTPIVRCGRTIVVGDDPAGWQQIAQEFGG